MKRIAMTTILLGALGIILPAPQARAQVSASVSIGGFYDELSPYGEWVDCTYGECWVPRGVDAGWQPYTNGEWIYTRYGWTWASSDPWGGDPYHYGTWAFVDRYGWAWVPGTVWAPAWVTWSYSDRYVGWAPMPPTVVFGSAGYSGRPVVLNEARYVFVPTNRFVGVNVGSVRVESRRNAEIFRETRPVTRFGVSGGFVTNAAIPMATVQRAMGGRIQTREIGTAHTAPRTLSSGGPHGTGHLSIVAPEHDLRAAHASRQGAEQHAAAPEPQHAKPADQHEQAKVQQPAQPQHAKRPEVQTQHAKPADQHQQAKVQQPAQPQQGHEKAIPAGKEPEKQENKDKKDRPGGGQ